MTHNSPRISVVINSYNSQRYIGAALDSVLAQTRPPCEVLVMDDGSTDDTRAVVHQYGPTVRWQQQPHAGVGAARNNSLAHVHGEVVAFLDADDFWTPAKLALQADCLRAHPGLEAVFGYVRQLLDPQLDPALAARLWAPDIPVPGRIASTLMITPRAYARVGGFATGLQITEFLDWYARALEAGLAMAMVPEVVAWRRIHGNNQSMRDQADMLEYPRVIKAALDRRRRARPAADTRHPTADDQCDG